MHKWGTPNLVLFPIQVPIELFQNVFHTIIRQVGDSTSFVQEERLGLQCMSIFLWAIYVVVDVSRNLDIRTSEVSMILERPPFCLGCKLIRRRLLVLHILVVLL